MGTNACVVIPRSIGMPSILSHSFPPIFTSILGASLLLIHGCSYHLSSTCIILTSKTSVLPASTVLESLASNPPPVTTKDIGNPQSFLNTCWYVKDVGCCLVNPF